MGHEPQAVLLTYLRVVLTQWEELYESRAAEIMKAITNSSLVTDIFSNMLKSKVGSQFTLSDLG